MRENHRLLKTFLNETAVTMEDSSGAADAVVFFDLETTGLDQNCEIVQLAAVSGRHWLNLYTVPGCRINHSAARVTGFQVRRHRLYLHRQPVLTSSLREVLVAFLAFLRMLGRPLLVGHNIRRFDCPVLARALDGLQLRATFTSLVSGCVDTLPLLREMLKDRGLKSFRQDNLVREVLGLTYRAHNALEDVRALQSLYRALQPTQEVLCKHVFTLDTIGNKPTAVRVKGLNQCPLVEQGAKVTESSGEGPAEGQEEV